VRGRTRSRKVTVAGDLELVKDALVWIADRNFCHTVVAVWYARTGCILVIATARHLRSSPLNLSKAWTNKKLGKSIEQLGVVTNGDGEQLKIRVLF